MPKTSATLYDAIKKHLEKHSKEHFTAGDLYDVPAIRAIGGSPNRVSDYLGNLWRRGFLSRLASSKTDQFNARWMYRWKGKPDLLIIPDDADVEVRSKAVVMQRPEVVISEDGDIITVETSTLIFIIKTKK